MSNARRARPGEGQMPSVVASRIPCTSAAFAELSAEILQAGNALRFRAHGASMSPLVRDGDVVWVRPADPDSLRVGDVVLCGSQAARAVVHRVVRRLEAPEGPRFMVQGDQVARPDGVIPNARVYGRVTAIERDGKKMDTDAPVMRWLGWFAVVRSRLALGRGSRFRLARRLFKRLPVLSRYLT